MRKYRINILLLSFSLFIFLNIACSNPENELNSFLTQKEIQYEEIAFELGDAYWNYYSAEAVTDLKAPKNKFYNLLHNDTLNTLINTWYPRRNEIADTILKRRVEKWHHVLLSASVEYDKEIMELRNELEEMMEVSGDKDVSEYDFDGKVLELIKLRNQKSIELGYDNYVHLSFETNGLGYKWFMDFVNEIEESTYTPFNNLVQQAKAENKIKNFGQTDLFQFIGQFYRNNDPVKLKTKDNIELVKISLNNIGINYSELPAKLVEMELPAGVGGQGLMINIPNDFRAVMTLGMDISVWMHEMGHGLHGLFNSINTPILEGYEWIPGNSNASFAEGMAETNAMFCRNAEWQKEYTNLTEEQIIERKKITNEYAPAFIRYHLYNFMRETELYLHPEKSYDEIQIELAKKYFFIDSKKIRTQGLKNIIFVSYPLYLQNYLLADIIAIQIHKALEEKFGKNYAFNKEVGKYLTDNFYSNGEYYNWNERLIKGTGETLNIEKYLEYYNIK